MKNDFADTHISYLTEVAIQLRQAGFAVSPTENPFLSVGLEGQRLCRVTEGSEVWYQEESSAGEARSAALDKVIAIARMTAEYTSQMASAPRLTADGLSGDYRLLAEFNGTVLAGHLTQYGAQFITWDWDQRHASLDHGHYYGPSAGVDSYTSAKQGFAVRAGLIPHSALFNQEQLAEIYLCVDLEMDGSTLIRDDGFMYFRSWLISRGKGVYMSVMRDPDSLADIPFQDGEDLNFELFGYSGIYTYEKKFGFAFRLSRWPPALSCGAVP